MESHQNQNVLDFSRCRQPPFAHQKHGVIQLVKWDEPAIGRQIGGVFALFDEMGSGKSFQTITAAQFLYTLGLVETVLILAPAGVRSVWFDEELGELQKHLWTDLPSTITEVHARTRNWQFGPDSTKRLHWIITNYEFIRRKPRLQQLKPFTGLKTLIVLDESSAVKNPKALQTKAALELRNQCARVVLLNGTPIGNSPMDMFSQGQVMDPRILQCSTLFHFRSRYAVVNTFAGFPKITGWQNLEDLQRRFKPYVLRRLKEECLDLPKKLPSVTLTVTMTDDTWNIYRQMRDDFIAWLDNDTVSTAAQAVVKAMRLAQITSGFLGGTMESHNPGVNFDEDEEPVTDLEKPPAWLDKLSETLLDGARLTQDKFISPTLGNPTLAQVESLKSTYDNNTREVGREKLDALFVWLEEQLVADPNFKVLVWCRWKAELLRIEREVKKRVEEDGVRWRNDPKNVELELATRFRNLFVGSITGGQRKDARDNALRMLDPRTAPPGPALVVGSPRAGGKGLNLTAAHTVIYVSNDYSLEIRSQSEDRVHRPGQVHAVSYFDMIAVGPGGQRTIDHSIIKSLRNKDDVARWTTAAWKAELLKE